VPWWSPLPTITAEWSKLSKVSFEIVSMEFLPDRDDVDPRPSKEDTDFMKERGWRWRGEEKAWTKQLARNTEEKWAARGDSDLEAHKEFVELANLIRQRNGHEPVSGITSEGRGA
jgi:hypothetical protein